MTLLLLSAAVAVVSIAIAVLPVAILLRRAGREEAGQATGLASRSEVRADQDLAA